MELASAAVNAPSVSGDVPVENRTARVERQDLDRHKRFRVYAVALSISESSSAENSR